MSADGRGGQSAVQSSPPRNQMDDAVRTPAVISLRGVFWGDARAPPRLA